MLGLYRMNFHDGRNGGLESLFVASDDAIKKAIGKEVYFGEVLGKHSEVFGQLEENDLTLVSDDPLYIALTLRAFGRYSICGLNPLTHINDEDDDEDDLSSPEGLRAIIGTCCKFEAKYGDLEQFSVALKEKTITLEEAEDWIKWKQSASHRQFYLSRFEGWREKDKEFQKKYGMTFHEFHDFWEQAEGKTAEHLHEDYKEWKFIAAEISVFKEFISCV